MATETKTTKKQPKKKAPKVDKFVYDGREYIVLERKDGKVKITDGTIHFWTKDEQAD
jgi:hypothetical protein